MNDAPTDTSETNSQAPADPDAPRFGPGARALIVAAIVLVIVGGYLLLTSGGDDPATAPMPASPYENAEKVEVSEVAGLPEEVGHGVYWAGEKSGEAVGVSTDASGNVHLRYLPEEIDADTPDAGWLDVGSYPFPGAYKATTDLSREKGNVAVKVPGAVAFYPKSRPTSVILAFRNDPDVQVEVYHPDPEKALAFAKSGAIVPVP